MSHAESIRSGKYLAELIWREFATQQLVLHPLLARSPAQPAVREAGLARLGEGFPRLVTRPHRLRHGGCRHARALAHRLDAQPRAHDHRLIPREEPAAPWQQGERWFWDTLVDADLASNALNWQWVAGTSPDAAPWFRVFNPGTHAEKVRSGRRVSATACSGGWHCGLYCTHH